MVTCCDCPDVKDIVLWLKETLVCPNEPDDETETWIAPQPIFAAHTVILLVPNAIPDRVA